MINFYLFFILDDIPEIILKQDDSCISAFGACLSYLKVLKIDKTLIPNCSFNDYNSSQSGSLIMDAEALINLEIFENNTDHTPTGSLFNYLDHCSTKCGQRLLRQWLCSPLQDIDKIEERLNSIEWLKINKEFLESVPKTFKNLPDLERCISRLKSGSNLKVSNLVEVLYAFQNLVKFIKKHKFSENDLKGFQVCDLLDFKNSKLFLCFSKTLFDFCEGFDQEKAKQDNFIQPKPGKDEEYDQAENIVKEIHKELESHLIKQKKKLGIPIKYAHMQKEKYQIEISVSELQSISLPKDFQLVSNTKAVKRFYDEFIKEKLKELANAEEDFNVAKENVFKNFLHYFNSFSGVWNEIVHKISELDVLCSLALISFKSSIDMCRPEFLRDSNGSYFDIKDIRHPMLCVNNHHQFISNSISMGTENHPSRIMLLTGPNMGGKSTLLRQLCLLVVMAQIGCYVPASYCKLATVDRIFTRLGASDNILLGQSTFMVELQETSTILHHVSDRSLVILDELGRGTSTFDGYSIAYATLAYLSQNSKASILFSTHYHALTEEFKHDKNIYLNHMACNVDENLFVFLFFKKLNLCSYVSFLL